jgi:hypothetical protein
VCNCIFMRRPRSIAKCIAPVIKGIIKRIISRGMHARIVLALVNAVVYANRWRASLGFTIRIFLCDARDMTETINILSAKTLFHINFIAISSTMRDKMYTIPRKRTGFSHILRLDFKSQINETTEINRDN